MPELTNEKFAQLMDLFEEIRTKQWAKGAEDYGQTLFAELPLEQLFDMYYEECADIANYAAMTFARLKLMEEELAGRLDNPIQPSGQGAQHWVPSSAGSFTGKSSVRRLLQDDERVQDS